MAQLRYISQLGALNIDSANRVGIGVTSPDANTKLTVNGNVLVGGGSAYAGTGVTALSINNDLYPVLSLGSTSASRMALIAYSSYNLFTSSQPFVFDTTSDVGIGVTVPDTKLHVADSSFDVMTLERPNVSGGGVSLKWINGDGFYWKTYHGGDERFYFDYQESTKFVIESGGNVGIGVTDPDRLLTIDNTSLSTNNPALRVKNNNSSSSIIAQFENDSDSIIIKSIGAGDYAIHNSQQGNGINMYDGTGGVELTYNGSWVLEATSAGGIDVNGEFRATADVIAYSSDERLKENIKPIENALDKVMQLKGVTFDWHEKIDDLGFEPRNKKNDVGLIAQDVEKVLPQLIAPAPFDQDIDDDGKVISKSGENYKTVQYDRMVSLLVEAIKEQQKQIDELKAMIYGNA